MSGQVALVTGTSGIVGSGVAWALLQRGCTVVAPCRSEAAVQSLKKEVGEHEPHKLIVSIADISDEYACRDLAQSVKDKFGQIDHAVSVVGGFQMPGELSQQTAQELRKYFDVYTVPHLNVYAAFLPLLKDEETSSYTFISGALGANYIPGVSLLTAGQGGLFGLSVAARGECQSRKLRVNEVRLSERIEKHTDCAGDKKGSTSCRVFGEVVADVMAGKTKGEVVHVGAKDLKQTSSRVRVDKLDSAGIV